MRGSLLLFIFLVFTFPLLAQSIPCEQEVSTAHFSFNQCVASQSYEEFTAEIFETDDCNPISIVGGNLYRDNPTFNMHSCTPGVSSLGMCVSIDENCSFDPASDKAVKVDVLISPESGSSASLSGISFFEQSSPFYLWQYGQTGDNDYPTKYSVSVKVNGNTIYSQSDINTNLTWTEQLIDFSTNPSFTVSSPTVFNIELLAYCPVGNGAYVSVWDIDEMSIDASCSSTPEGGMLSGGHFEFCVNDGVADYIDSTALLLSGNTGSSSQWIITDQSRNILGLPDHFSDVDFDGAPAGTCLVYHLSYEGNIEGLELGNNVSQLMGCYGLSNSEEVRRRSVSGGTLLGGPFVFCVGDGVSDIIAEDQIILSGNNGDNSQWVITDDQGTILGLPGSFSDVDFDGAGLGTCLIWHLSFADGIQGATVGNNASDLQGCFSLSNPIEVQRSGPQGGTLEGGPFTFCVGDGFSDFINPGDIILSGNTGTNSQWVVTDDQGVILGLPPMLSAVDFDDAGIGTCLVWHLSFEDGLEGAAVGNNAADLTGCFNLSNPIEVNRTTTEAAVLEGGPFVFCAGDGSADFIDSSEIVINGGVGGNTQWVVTDQQGDILGLPPHFSAVDFDGAGTGICLLWLVHYEGTLNGAMVGNNASLLSGCFSLSNSIPVVRNETLGGVIEGGPFTFCVGDGEDDFISDSEIELSGNIGANSQWVVTDEQGNILGLPGSFSDVNFEDAGEGTCLIWHLSFENGLQGAMVGNNASDLEGCFSLSNSIEVVRITDPSVCGNVVCPMEEEMTLFGLFDNRLITISTATGQITSIIPLITPLETASSLAWHEDEDVFYVVGTNNTIPTLHTIDRYTGMVTEVGPMYPSSSSIPDFTLVESLEYNSNNGKLYASAGDNPASANFFTRTLYEVNPATAECISIGNINGSCHDEADRFGYADNVLYYYDNCAPGIEFGSVDITNGNQTFIRNITEMQSGRIEGNPINGQLYIMDATEIQMYEMSDIGAVTLLGDVYPSDLFSETIKDIEFATYVTNNITGGILQASSFGFCVDDGLDDFIGAGDINLFGNSGTENQWVITDEQGNILGLPDDYSEVNFEGAGSGTCLVWNLSFEGTLMNLEVGQNASDLEGCFALSNPIQVNREEGCGIVNCPEEEQMRLWGIIDNDLLMMDISTGQLLKTIPLISSFAPDFSGLTWDEEQDIFYVVAEKSSNPTLATIDRFTGVVTSIGKIDQTIPGFLELTVVDALEYNPDNGILFASGGSNPPNNNFKSSFLYQLDKNTGDAIRLGAFENSCDEEADALMYANSVWYYSDNCAGGSEFGTVNLATADQNFIRNITEVFGGRMDAHPIIEQIYSADATARVLYTLNTDGVPTEIGEMYPAGLFNNILRDIDFAPYSDNGFYGGVLASDEITFCVDDGMDDFIEDGSIQIFGNNGSSNQWIISDDQGNILGLPDDYTDVNFEGVESGTCLLWNVSFSGPVENLEDGQNVFEFEGCFGLSNPIEIVREAGADCGNLNVITSDFKVFPNPTSDFITLECQLCVNDKTTFELFDARGNLVKSMNGDFINIHTIDVSDLAPGVYSLHMISGKQEDFKRFVIAR